jgi:26S proteasome regulatory subunit N10
MDNSDWTRNGDYHPNRWESQVEAANLLAENKCEKNPENGIGVISMAGKRVEVHVTLTNDVARLLNAIKGVNLSGECDFLTAMNIATLTLKHRQNKNQKQRIILFVGSPIRHTQEDLVQLGKKLKKYNIAVDIISFGNVDENRDLLQGFLDAVNNSNNSSMMEVPVGFYLIDSLFTSSLMSEVGGYGDMPVEDANFGGAQQPNVPSTTTTSNINQQAGGMTQFERDMTLAIQQSLEEERRKTEVSKEPVKETARPESDNVEMRPVEEENEEDELEKAKLMSMQEHEQVLQREHEEEDRVKDELLENQDFIKDILKGIDSTDIKEEDVEEVMKKIKEEKFEDKDKDDKKENKK